MTFPDERTARLWLVIHFVAPLLLATFAIGGVLGVQGHEFGTWLVVPAWLGWIAFIGANGWVYRRIERARTASRGRIAMSTRSTLLALFPTPSSMRAAFAALDVQVSASVARVASTAVLGALIVIPPASVLVLVVQTS